ncbi:MAG TPA: hypothetical protein VD995_06050 [Azospirillum sp.]|nr:hypothetical protein [Azospirillum sp.]
MSWRHKPVAVGDRFARAGQSSRVYVVVALDINRPGLPPHARLQVEDEPTEKVTIAIAALGDPTLYRRL